MPGTIVLSLLTEVANSLCSDVAKSKVDMLEEDVRQVNLQMSELSRTATDYSNMIQRKEAEIARLTAELTAMKKERDRSAQQTAHLENQLEVLLGDFETQKADREAESQARLKLQREIDELRATMAAKASQDSKLREVEKSKEQEMSSLRSETKKLHNELADARRLSLDTQNKLKVELEVAQRKLRELESSHHELVQKSTTNDSKLLELENSLAEASKSKRVIEEELRAVRTRQVDTDTQLEDTLREKEASA